MSQKKNTATKTREQFKQLFQTWKSETALLSSATAIINHPAYQRIIQMGDKVLPFIFIKLQNDPQHLFYALYQITGENPVPLAHAGNFKQMTADWLNWATEKGYILPKQETIASFVQLFEHHGYVICNHALKEKGFTKIALFEKNGLPTHAARQLPNGFWTSKLGVLEDVRHTLFAISGGLYGEPTIFLKKNVK